MREIRIIKSEYCENDFLYYLEERVSFLFMKFWVKLRREEYHSCEYGSIPHYFLDNTFRYFHTKKGVEEYRDLVYELDKTDRIKSGMIICDPIFERSNNDSKLNIVYILRRSIFEDEKDDHSRCIFRTKQACEQYVRRSKFKVKNTITN